ncbi:hypothetical protein [Acinetobacter indicus]|uniref:hypothetical protein n=1 Tax=Acinetobacter indicus TaxID=756892 RepID=UPI001443B4A4|nr:hypothetical protein [Acinetobacter indicus]
MLVKKERLRPLTIKDNVWTGIFSAILSIFFLFTNEYELALSCALISGFTLLFALFRKYINDVLPLSINWLFFLLLLFAGISTGVTIAQDINQSAQQKEMCGQVENIYIPQRRGIETFDLVNKQQRLNGLPYFRYKNQIHEASNQICVIYSHAEKWNKNPYIHMVKANQTGYSK